MVDMPRRSRLDLFVQPKLITCLKKIITQWILMMYVVSQYSFRYKSYCFNNRELLLFILSIIWKLNMRNEAPCFICSHYPNAVKFYFIFLNVLNGNMTYPIIEGLVISSLGSGNVGLFSRLQVVETDCLKTNIFNRVVLMVNAPTPVATKGRRFSLLSQT